MNKNFYGEKLLAHPDRLVSWMKQGVTDPIAIDFDLTNRCNNNCPKCNSAEYRDQTTVEFETAKDIISQLKDHQVNSITFGGGGEPCCHPNLAELIRFVKQKEMDIAVYTNGYGLSKDIMGAITECCTWARVSLDADGPEIYRKTHGMDAKAFNQVLKNIDGLVESKRDTNSSVTLGTCYLIGPHTVDGMYGATEISKNLGVNYIRLRPYFTWEGERNFKSEDGGKDMLGELARCKELATIDFSVSYPESRCQSEAGQEKEERRFEECHVPHFMASITADLKVYPCCSLKGVEKYCLGDLTENTFKDIWNSDRRKSVHRIISLEDCPDICAFSRHAELLWQIKDRPSDELKNLKESIPHKNFL